MNCVIQVHLKDANRINSETFVTLSEFFQFGKFRLYHLAHKTFLRINVAISFYLVTFIEGNISFARCGFNPIFFISVATGL